MDMNRSTLLPDKFCTMVYEWGGGGRGGRGRFALVIKRGYSTPNYDFEHIGFTNQQGLTPCPFSA